VEVSAAWPALLEEATVIPLREAHLCEDCRVVGNSATSCPACAGGALPCLASVLDREGGTSAEARKGESCD